MLTRSTNCSRAAAAAMLTMLPSIGRSSRGSSPTSSGPSSPGRSWNARSRCPESENCHRSWAPYTSTSSGRNERESTKPIGMHWTLLSFSRHCMNPHQRIMTLMSRNEILRLMSRARILRLILLGQILRFERLLDR